MRGEGAHRPEVAAVEREHRVSPVLGRQRHVDRVGQVQVEVETCVLLLDQACAGWSQPVEALELRSSPESSARRSSANTSAGVLNPSVARGRPLISSATVFR